MLRQHVVPGSVIYTDEFPAYDGIKEFREGFWLLVKTGIRGAITKAP